MAEKSNISWTDSTINFWSGCDKVLDQNGKLTDSGCKNCYIVHTPPFRVSGRKHGDPRVLHESAFKLAVKLNKKPWVCDCGKSYGRLFPNVPALGPCSCGRTVHRRRIFSLSLGDWLDPEVPAEWLARMLDTIRQCDQVIWILCSKRLEHFFPLLQSLWRFEAHSKFGQWLVDWVENSMPPKNIILLVSVENQAMADKRIPELEAIPAAVRGLSCEPLLGPIKFRTPADLTKIGWVIAGGESGPKARPCNVDWIRSIKDQCQAASVPCFVKQLGAFPSCEEFQHTEQCDNDHCALAGGPEDCDGEVVQARYLSINHPKGGDPAEWPADLRVQQFPEMP